MLPASRRLPLAAFSSSIALVAGLQAQDWTLADMGGFTPVRNGASAAFDLTRQEVVMFGGASDGSANGGLADTWVWNGTVWTQRTPATTPPTRWLAAMSYDISRSVVVMFGGRVHAGPVGATGFQNDLWEWDGTNWAQITSVNPPSPRYGPTMVYDLARGVHVLYGGTGPGNINLDETWEYSPATQTWTAITTANTPGERVYQAMAYDQSRGRTVVYGGRNGSFTPIPSAFWEYDGTDWTAVTPPNMPGDLYGHVMVYDQARQRIVMQGGRGASFAAGTWEYDGTNCYFFGVEPNPAPGSQHAAGAYDLLRNRTVVCGGYNASFARSNDTWERVPDRASFATFGEGCAGSAGVPQLSASTLPTLGGTYTLDLVNLPTTGGLAAFVTGLSNTVWNGLPLPLALASIGLPGCTDYVSVDATVLRGTTAGGAFFQLTIPNNPSLAGITFFNQALSIGSTLAVSNAGQALIY